MPVFLFEEKMDTVKNRVNELTPQEEKIINIVRSLDFGELRIVVNDKVPVRIEEIKKSIKL